MYHHSFELSFRYRNHTSISHNFLIRTYQLLFTCFQLPRSLVQNLQPSKLLRTEGRPNNLQSAWRLAGLFFWSDLSWLQADLCANLYVFSTHFSLLSNPPSCSRYISYVGILHIIHNVLFRISIIFNNMAIRPYRFSSYLWFFVFFDFWITCTYSLILFWYFISLCFF